MRMCIRMHVHLVAQDAGERLVAIEGDRPLHYQTIQVSLARLYIASVYRAAG